MTIEQEIHTQAEAAKAASYPLAALPPGIREILPAYDALRATGDMLPFAALGMGWALPAAVGTLLGYLLSLQKKGLSPAK